MPSNQKINTRLPACYEVHKAEYVPEVLLGLFCRCEVIKNNSDHGRDSIDDIGNKKEVGI